MGSILMIVFEPKCRNPLQTGTSESSHSGRYPGGQTQTQELVCTQLRFWFTAHFVICRERNSSKDASALEGSRQNSRFHNDFNPKTTHSKPDRIMELGRLHLLFSRADTMVASYCKSVMNVVDRNLRTRSVDLEDK